MFESSTTRLEFDCQKSTIYIKICAFETHSMCNVKRACELTGVAVKLKYRLTITMVYCSTKRIRFLLQGEVT